MTRITTALAAYRERLRDRDEGFTLIELLVVVIIIGILAAIAIPVYIGVQNNAKDSAVQSDLTNIKTAVIAYQTDTQLTPMPALDAATLGKYGYTNSGTYTTAPVKKAGSTATLFCIDGTSKTGTAFLVSSNLGVAKGSCSAITTTW